MATFINRTLVAEKQVANVGGSPRILAGAHSKVIRSRSLIQSHLWRRHGRVVFWLVLFVAAVLRGGAKGGECEAKDDGYAEEDGKAWEHGVCVVVCFGGGMVER